MTLLTGYGIFVHDIFADGLIDSRDALSEFFLGSGGVFGVDRSLESLDLSSDFAAKGLIADAGLFIRANTFNL